MLALVLALMLALLMKTRLKSYPPFIKLQTNQLIHWLAELEFWVKHHADRGF